jgi:hypothetical protein
MMKEEAIDSWMKAYNGDQFSREDQQWKAFTGPGCFERACSMPWPAVDIPFAGECKVNMQYIRDMTSGILPGSDLHRDPWRRTLIGEIAELLPAYERRDFIDANDEKDDYRPSSNGRKYDNQQDRNAAYKARWLAEGDDYIIQAVAQLGRDWTRIRMQLWEDRQVWYDSTKRLQERYDRMLNPDMKRGRLTQDESNQILEHVMEYGERHWTELAKQLNRCARRCQRHWLNVLKPLHPEIMTPWWDEEKDAKILACVEEYGEKQLGRVAKEFGRLIREVRERWNAIKEESSCAMFSAAEDVTLVETVKKIGRRWTEIQKMFAGRTVSAVRCRHDFLVQAAT